MVGVWLVLLGGFVGEAGFECGRSWVGCSVFLVEVGVVGGVYCMGC